MQCTTCAGKYNKDNLPSGPRSFTINAERVEQIEPLISVMREIGAAHGGKTPGQARFFHRCHDGHHAERLCLLDAPCCCNPTIKCGKRVLTKESLHLCRLQSTGPSARALCPSQAPRMPGRPGKQQVRLDSAVPLTADPRSYVFALQPGAHVSHVVLQVGSAGD